MTRPQDAATEALAEAMASLNGHDGVYRLAKAGKMSTVGFEDAYERDAELAIKFMKRRGYVIRKARKSG